MSLVRFVNGDINAAEAIAKPFQLLLSYSTESKISVLVRTSLGSSFLQFPRYRYMVRMHQWQVAVVAIMQEPKQHHKILLKRKSKLLLQITILLGK
jgi:hypothetical protein